MNNAHESPTLGPAMLGVAVLLVVPAVPLDSLIATFTATPLREAVGVLLIAGVVAGMAFWLTPGINIRTVLPAEGGDA